MGNRIPKTRGDAKRCYHGDCTGVQFMSLGISGDNFSMCAVLHSPLSHDYVDSHASDRRKIYL
jgi:hypothetical protein